MSLKQQNSRKRLAASFLILFCLCIHGYIPVFAAEVNSGAAQQKQNQVTVTVLDENGEPIPGAGIMVVSTRLGGVTDLDGKATWVM